MIEAAESKECPTCGFKQEDFIKSLRFGCPDCYRVFRSELSTFLPRMHHGSSHRGKVPQSFKPSAQLPEQDLQKAERFLIRDSNASAVDGLPDR